MLIRPRRNRKSKSIRELVAETNLRVTDFVYPLFVEEGNSRPSEIKSMPGIFRYSKKDLLKEMESCLTLGLTSFALFPAIEGKKKDKQASESLNTKGLYLSTIKEVKKQFPESNIISDVAMDPYSSDGHDGWVEGGEILNDKTLEILSAMAVAQAEAGADIVAPSDMMDGRVRHIRESLDKNGYTSVSIMSYCAKYASHFYGPFREALDSAPKAGDKKTYQMDFRNRREAMREAILDQREGADFLMVKPALSYLDVISDLKKQTHLPIAAYNVSGEFAMVKAAARNGWISEKGVRDEILYSIKRAGADIILSYFAKEWASDQ
jgi:porphobilinogen synthase